MRVWGNSADGTGKLGVYAVGRLSSLPLNRLHMLMRPPRTDPEGFGGLGGRTVALTDEWLCFRYAFASVYSTRFGFSYIVLIFPIF